MKRIKFNKRAQRIHRRVPGFKRAAFGGLKNAAGGECGEGDHLCGCSDTDECPCKAWKNANPVGDIINPAQSLKIKK